MYLLDANSFNSVFNTWTDFPFKIRDILKMGEEQKNY